MASTRKAPTGGRLQSGGIMKILVAEDDFSSRLVLQKLLAPYGEVHLAMNGREAVDAFETAEAVGSPYAVVCLDIMMPQMDGQEVLRTIRAIEQKRGVPVGTGAKVIMTTALDDGSNVMRAFREQCDAYLVKPIHPGKLREQLQILGLTG
jgi:two-component system chemotaxis response regulator CheY